MNNELIDVMKIFVFTSIFFVWVVRYKNIIHEFQVYKLPDWLRDLVGITKGSFAVMLLTGDNFLIKCGAIGIMCLMLAAMITHIKIKNSITKMLPSMMLFGLCAIIFFTSRS